VGDRGGIALAIAVGTKASALLPAAGIVAGVAVYGLAVERRFLAWPGGALAILGLSGIAWGFLVYLPHRTEIADDLRTRAMSLAQGSGSGRGCASVTARAGVAERQTRPA
jgi:hypothetical protein